MPAAHEGFSRWERASVGRYVARRLLELVGLLVVVSAVIFFALRLGPFQPEANLSNVGVSPARIAEVRAQWHLDRPLLVQYANYLGGAVRGDFGRSFIDNRPVTTAIKQRLPVTIQLAVFAMLVGSVAGLGLGVLSALRRSSATDTASRTVALTGISLPSFWLGLMGIAVFSVKLGWLPSGGGVDASLVFAHPTGFYVLDGIIAGRWDVVVSALEHIVLPGLVLGTFIAGYVARITRTTMIEALSQDYIRTALAKGSPVRHIVVKDALPNTALPVLTVLGLLFGLLLSGAAVTETVFAYPGMGQLLVNAISGSDFPQIQASVLVLAAIYCFVNAVVDILYAVADPRVTLA